jgi:hypothetical protein
MKQERERALIRLLRDAHLAPLANTTSAAPTRPPS